MPGSPYHHAMPPRLQHALRFALPNLVAVLVAALAYELVEAFGRGVVPPGMTAGGVVAANMGVWVLIAVVVGIVTFLLRLSDVVTRAPGWGFAWLYAAWVALACVLVVHAVEAGAFGVGIGIGVAAVVIWLAIHRRIPGWPGATRAADAPDGRSGERNLP
jgi:hypothetical protein